MFDHYIVDKIKLSNVFVLSEVDKNVFFKGPIDISSNAVGNYGIKFKFIRILSFKTVYSEVCK